MGRLDSSPRYAWFLLGFLTLLNVMNFVDRQLIASFGEPITRDLHLELWEFGLLTGLAFILFYTFVGVFLGTVADRWNRPRLIALGLLLWSALTAASGLAQNFWQMAAARILIGIGEATLTPAALSMLSDVFHPRRRALASGIYYLGIPVGAGLSLILSGRLEPILGGWRPCFYLLGGIGIPLGLAVWFLRDPPRGAQEQVAGSAAKQQTVGDLFRCLRKSPALVLTILGGVALLFAIGATNFDMLWLRRERGFTQREAGDFLGPLVLVGGSAGSLIGGALGDLWHRRRPGGRLLFLACGLLVLCPCWLAFRLLPAGTLLFGVAGFLGVIMVLFFYGPLFATVQDLVPARIRSTTVAFLIFSINILGLAPGSFTAGKLAAALGSLTWGLFATGLVGLASVPLFLLAARRYRTDLG